MTDRSKSDRSPFMQKLRIATVHLILWFAVLVYLLFGGLIFYRMERNVNRYDSSFNRSALVSLSRQFVRNLTDSGFVDNSEDLRQILGKLNSLADVRGSMLVEDLTFEEMTETFDWTYPASILFSFTTITTIGYGNICPTTTAGKLFCIVYATFGIPLTMLAIADLGKFFWDFLEWAVWNVQRASAWILWNQSMESQGTYKEKRGSVKYLLLLIFFLFYAVLTAVLLPVWENLSFLDSLYFSFITLTTIGFGDIVPQEMSFLPFTLLLLTIGLALTTMSIEVAADGFRKIHFLGAKLRDARNAVIWFGGKKLTVGELLSAVGKNLALDDLNLDELDLDEIVGHAIEEKEHPIAHQPAAVVPEEFLAPNKPIEPDDFKQFEGQLDDICFVDSEPSSE